MPYHGGALHPNQESPESRYISAAAASNDAEPLTSPQAAHKLSRGVQKRSMALSSCNASLLQDSISPPRHGSWRWLFAGFCLGRTLVSLYQPSAMQCSGSCFRGERSTAPVTDATRPRITLLGAHRWTIRRRRMWLLCGYW